jgi:serine phosphatase RsbU (regulator of sigma subunit)
MITSGPWRHGVPPDLVPAWVMAAHGFAGTVVYVDPAAPGAPRLLIRAAVPTADNGKAVVVDLPLDAGIAARLRDRTGTSPGAFSAHGCGTADAPRDPTNRGLASLFRQTVAFMNCTDWSSGTTGDIAIDLDAPLGALSDRLASIQSSAIAASVGDSWWRVFVDLLVLLGALFLVIQSSALVMGWVLARSITSAVHELFIGTERIREGDFAHRIRVESRDQLGDLSASFNRMSASVEQLLHVQREKQRLDDELRIARDIQKSLLPVTPPELPGLDVADLCEPAREVGGDYYDFFSVGPRQLGILIADVSGKGVSAALYMAELKGLMLALSHAEPSPRRLLVDVNHRLAEQLDNRSFITMTYAVIDLDRMTLTHARAGHTPLIVVSDGRSEVITPDGMVVGLRLPGAEGRFEDLLVEDTRRIRGGDVIVLYTDGVTEAMNGGGDLFGDEALATVLAGAHGLDAGGIRERVLRDVRAFVGEAEPHDDMTMIVLKVGDGREAHV